VVATQERVSRQIIVYSWVTVACTLLLVPATGWLYAVCTIAFGAWFLITAHRLHSGIKRGVKTNPMTLFHVSNTYLMLVFVALAVDSALHLRVIGF
jgi:protoheme IX farnesyltransferase